MKKSDQQQSSEIESFNHELVAFDMNDLSIEELERRFELAVAAVGVWEAACGVLSCSEVTCSELTCGVFDVPET